MWWTFGNYNINGTSFTINVSCLDGILYIPILCRISKISFSIFSNCFAYCLQIKLLIKWAHTFMSWGSGENPVAWLYYRSQMTNMKYVAVCVKTRYWVISILHYFLNSFVNKETVKASLIFYLRATHSFKLKIFMYFLSNLRTERFNNWNQHLLFSMVYISSDSHKMQEENHITSVKVNIKLNRLILGKKVNRIMFKSNYKEKFHQAVCLCTCTWQQK